MRTVFILLAIFAFGMACTKNPSQQVENSTDTLKAIAFQWQYISAYRCPYNPESLAPCYEWSAFDQSVWDRDSSYLKIDANGNAYQNIQGINGYNSVKDSFHVIRINDSLLSISPLGAHPATSISIRTLQNHLLVLQYIGDPLGNIYGLDSLAK